MMHALHDVELGHALEKWIHPDLLHLLPGINLGLRLQEDYNYNLNWCELGNRMPDTEYRMLAKAAATVHRYGSFAFKAPVFSELFCRRLLCELRVMEHTTGIRFAPNQDEDSDFQIPEIVLEEVCPVLGRGIYDTALCSLWKWFQLAYNIKPGWVSSIQVANYTPQGTSHGNWHHDEDSDYTAVVSLDPDAYVGGGTDLKDGFGSTVHIPKIPQGHALIFPGKHVMHRGCAVESGRRLLLVFWLKLKEDGK